MKTKGLKKVSEKEKGFTLSFKESVKAQEEEGKIKVKKNRKIIEPRRSTSL